MSRPAVSRGQPETIAQPGTARIPSLDGLRAVSIALVVVGHVHLTMPALRDSILWATLGNGDLGVSIFFVISGFLITSLLLREEDKTGRVSLRGFYARRFFRIVPPLYAFLAVIVVLWRVEWLTLSWRALASAATFTADYWQPRTWWLGHTWSLSVEEQFYLLWPPAFVALGRRRALSTSLAIVTLAPAVRGLSYYFWPDWRPGLVYMFHARADGLMFGCALALLLDHTALERMGRALMTMAAAAASFLFIVSPILRARFQGVYLLSLGYSLEGAAITLLVFYLVSRPDSSVGRILNSPPLAHVGVLSYSLYLWQELFLTGESPFLGGAFPMNVILAYAAAELSYRTVERVAAKGRARWRTA